MSLVRHRLMLKCKMSTIKGEPTMWAPGKAESKVRLRPPVSKQQLLRHTEFDPEGAEEFLELLRESRRDPRGRVNLE